MSELPRPLVAKKATAEQEREIFFKKRKAELIIEKFLARFRGAKATSEKPRIREGTPGSGIYYEKRTVAQMREQRKRL